MIDLDAYYAQRWHDFESLPKMIDHWYWRPGWRVGRSFYTWHLTFTYDDAVRRLASTYQDRITLPFLDPVPLEGLHMTLQGVGFTDEVSPKELAAILDAARVRCGRLGAFELKVGPADADEQGVPLAIAPWAPIVELRTALRAAIADVWGTDDVPDSAEGFRPHITVFYANALADPSPLRPLLLDLRAPSAVSTVSTVSTTVSAVSLIKLNRDHKIYQWETIASVAL